MMVVAMVAAVVEAIKEGLVITRATVGIFWLLKMGKIASPQKAALDASEIIKLSKGVITGALFKDYAVYKKWLLRATSGENFLWFIKAIKKAYSIFQSSKFLHY